MKSNVDKIVGVFTKTVNKLRDESIRLESIVYEKRNYADALLSDADVAEKESIRAQNLAAKIEELISA